MKEIKTKKGVLKYRLPNIAEGMFFVSLFEAVSNNKDVWLIKSRIIENSEKLIDFKSCEYASYDELLNDKKNMTAALKEISEEIFNDILDLLSKKN